MSSSMNMYVGCEDEEDGEESGWTDYLDDFSLNRKANTSCNNSSMVSDAAWNGFNGNYNANPLLKRLNFKNKSKDDDLQDTASSPVNSPKVSSSKEMDVNCKRTDTFGHLLGQQKAVGVKFSESEIRRDEKVGGAGGEYVELKRRGLCVVPMSVFVNYIGSDRFNV